MWKAQIKPNNEYALREKRTPNTPFQRVRIIEHIRGNKWKAEWIDPNPGLIHYVESGNLIVPWKELKAFLKEEAAEQRMREHNAQQGYEKDSPVACALQQIFECVGDKVGFGDGCLSGP